MLGSWILKAQDVIIVGFVDGSWECICLLNMSRCQGTRSRISGTDIRDFIDVWAEWKERKNREKNEFGSHVNNCMRWRIWSWRWSARKLWTVMMTLYGKRESRVFYSIDDDMEHSCRRRALLLRCARGDCATISVINVFLNFVSYFYIIVSCILSSFDTNLVLLFHCRNECLIENRPNA